MSLLGSQGDGQINLYAVVTNSQPLTDLYAFLRCRDPVLAELFVELCVHDAFEALRRSLSLSSAAARHLKHTASCNGRGQGRQGASTEHTARPRYHAFQPSRRI